jgi:hypothetical protein
MAACAGDGGMLAGKFECCKVMIERSRGPARSGVAGTATHGTKLTAVGVIFCMTGIAICGCPDVHTIVVAIGAGYSNMLSGQFEICEIVIKGGG